MAKRGRLETIGEIVGPVKKKPGEEPAELGADIEEMLAQARKNEALAKMSPKDRKYVEDYFKVLEEAEKGEKPSMVAREAGEAERARAKQAEAFARMPKKDRNWVRNYFKTVLKYDIGK